MPGEVLGSTGYASEPKWQKLPQMPFAEFYQGLRERNWTNLAYDANAPVWNIQFFQDSGRFLRPCFDGFRHVGFLRRHCLHGQNGAEATFGLPLPAVCVQMAQSFGRLRLNCYLQPSNMSIVSRVSACLHSICRALVTKADGSQAWVNMPFPGSDNYLRDYTAGGGGGAIYRYKRVPDNQLPSTYGYNQARKRSDQALYGSFRPPSARPG